MAKQADTKILEELVCERVLELDDMEEKRERINKDISEFYQQCKKDGLNTKVLRKVIQLRASNPHVRKLGDVPLGQYMLELQKIMTESMTGKSDSDENDTDEEESAEAAE